jgi:hypothetical protein
MITINNYLDFGSIFVNEVVGDPFLAYVILMIVLVIACIRMGFNEKITGLVFAFATLLFVTQYYALALLVIIAVLIVAALWGFKDLFTR